MIKPNCPSYTARTAVKRAPGCSFSLPRCRSPPKNLNLAPAHLQIFGGIKMLKTAMSKNFSNFFCNHQVRLGVSLLGLSIGLRRKGVSTWVYTSAV